MAHKFFEGEEHTKLYQQFRMKPPQKLVERVIEYLREKYKEELNVAIDVGCGSGQSTDCYANYFNKIIGLDVSANQITTANAKNQLPNVFFEVSSAENLNFPPNSVQLITAMESAHWFDLPKFFAQVSRILSPNGVVALYIYNVKGIRTIWDKNVEKSEKLDQILQQFVHLKKPLEKYRQPQTEIALGNYKSVTIPLDDFIRQEDSYFDERRLNLRQILGRLQTSSMFQLMKQQEGEETAQIYLHQVETKIMEVIKDDLSEEEDLPENIYFNQRTPFTLLLARKSK